MKNQKIAELQNILAHVGEDNRCLRGEVFVALDDAARDAYWAKEVSREELDELSKSSLREVDKLIVEEAMARLDYHEASYTEVYEHFMKEAEVFGEPQSFANSLQTFTYSFCVFLMRKMLKVGATRVSDVFSEEYFAELTRWNYDDGEDAEDEDADYESEYYYDFPEDRELCVQDYEEYYNALVGR